MAKKTKSEKQIQSESISEYVSKPGFGQEMVTEETTEEFDPAVKQALYDEVSRVQKYDQPVRAFAEGVVRGVLPGADVVLKKGLGVKAEDIAARKEYNPIASGTGEMTGLIGGAVVAPEASLGGGLLQLEKGVVKKITESTFKSAAQRKIAENIIKQSAASATSGAVAGVNQLVNEAALGNADLTGENFLAYAGTGAVLGGLVGGAFGAAESAIPKLQSATDKATGQVKRIFAKEADPDRAFSELISPHAHGREKVFEIIKGMDPEVKVDFLTKKLNLGATTDTEQLWKNNKKFLKDGGEEIGNIYKAADELNAKQGKPGIIDSVELYNNQLSALDKWELKNPEALNNAANRSAFERVKDEVKGRYGKKAMKGGFETAEEVHKAAQYYGNMGRSAFGDAKDVKLAAKLYADLNGTTKNLLLSKMDEQFAGTEISGLVSELKKLDKQYSAALTIDKYLSKKAATSSGFSEARNNILTVLGAAGILSGDEQYQGLGTVAATLALGSKFLNSDLRRRLVVLADMNKANQKATQNVSQAIKTVLKIPYKGAKATIPALTKSSLMYSGLSVGEKKKQPDNDKEAFKNIQANLVEFASNPQKLTERIAINTLKSNYAAPNATVFAQAAIRRGVQFLHEKIPKDMYVGSDLTGKKVWEPSGMQLAQFKRYVQVVEHPYSILSDLEKGTLTREHVEALQVVYPAIYSNIRDQILGEIKNSPESVPYSKKVQIGILLGAPTDASLRPENIMALQNNFVQEDQQESAAAVNTTVKGTQNIKKSERAASGMQEAQQGIEE